MPKSRTEESFPLSPAQETALCHPFVRPGSGVDAVQILLNLPPGTDLATLRRAWNRVVELEPILRTGLEPEAGRPSRLAVYCGVTPQFATEDWTGLSDVEREELWQELLRVDRERGFASGEVCLMRITVVRAGERGYWAVWTHHRAILDARSASMVLDRVSEAYDALCQEKSVDQEPSPGYRDYVDWRQGLDGSKGEAYWRSYLQGFSAATGLAIARRHPDGAFGPTRRQCEVRLKDRTAAELARVAARDELEPAAVIRGAWAILLSRYSGESEVVFGVSRSCRPAETAGADSMLGNFVNTLPLRTSVDGEQPFLTWMHQVDARWPADNTPAQFSICEVMMWSELADLPIFETVCGVDDDIVVAGFAAAKGARGRSRLEQSGFPLAVLGWPDRDHGLWIDYDPSRFEGDLVGRLADQLATILDAIAADPMQRVSELPILTSDEQERLVSVWSVKAREFDGDRCIHQLFEAQARRTPDAVAVVFGDRRWTYRELNRRANQLARVLRERGVGPDTLVGLCLTPGLDLMVGILAILKAGGAYLPLDLVNPSERISFILRDTEVPVLLTESGLLNRLPESSARVMCLDAERDTIAGNPSEDLGVDVTAGNLAYVIYTSGSTGRPKGVPIEHGSVARLFSATEDWFQFDERDVWTLFHSFAFDFSVWEMWGALFYGGRLVIVPQPVTRSPAEFHRLLVREGVTVLNQTPSAFRQLMRTDATSDPERKLALRLVIFGGEALELQTLEPWIERHGDLEPQLVNMFGITETTVHVTYRPITARDVRERRGSLIGRPIPDLRLFLLDELGRPVPPGMPGEIYVAGPGVARGYLGRPTLTAERFVPDPSRLTSSARMYRSGDMARYLPDGELEYLRRNDEQVQIHGFRVELGEIQAALVAHPAVRDAVVLVRGDGEDKRLVGYIVAEATNAPTPSALRSFAKERVPEYMLPAAFMRLDALPLTPNGKLDRRALPAPDRQSDEEYAAPRDLLERELAGIWQRVLKIDRIGIHDPFVNLGGDSIRGATIVAEIQTRLDETVYISAIFEAPTIAELAGYLRENYTDASARMTGLAVPRSVTTHASSDEVHPRVDDETIAGLRARIEPLEPRPGSHDTVSGRNRRMVFVLGAPRSGSTVFRIMLGGHPALFAPPELDLLSFNSLAERKAKCVGRYAFILEGAIRTILEIKGCDPDEARRIMEDLENRDVSVKGFYRLIQDWIGDRMLVEKTTIYGHDPATLRRAEDDFEDPLYIHLVRHPCGMIRSFVEARLDRIFRFEVPYSARVLGEALWCVHQENIVAFLDDIPEYRKHRVDFESLLSDPDSVMSGCADFLGIDLHPDMLDPYRNKQSRMTDGLYSVSRVIGDTKYQQHKSIEASVADQWIGQIDPASLGADAHEIAGELAYDLSDAHKSAPPSLAGQPVTHDQVDELTDEEVLAELRRLEQQDREV